MSTIDVVSAEVVEDEHRPSDEAMWGDGNKDAGVMPTGPSASSSSPSAEPAAAVVTGTWVIQKTYKPSCLTCGLCSQPGNDVSGSPDEMFNPCRCAAVHRRCFKEWRKSWITPRNYFRCPVCEHEYNIERAEKDFDPDSQDEKEIRSSFRWKIFLFYFLLILGICGMCALWSTIGWAADVNHKNIPVGIRYMTVSVAGGIVNTNVTTAWEEEFKRPETPTWPFYMLFGIVISSVTIIVIALSSLIYEKCCEDDDAYGPHYERARKQRCCEACHCHSHDCSFFAWSFAYTPGGTGRSCVSPECCDCMCNSVCCQCEGGGGGGGCGGCDACAGCGDGCDCDLGSDGEGAPVLVILVIVVVIAVLISAIFIIVYFAVTRLQQYHAVMSEMLYMRTAELEGKLMVLGRGESIRPNDAV